jgi:CoA-dependent NAD(P)H sulfur oxidoreductase
LNVTVLGRRPQVMPGYEEEIADVVQQELARHDVTVLTGTEAGSLEKTETGKIHLYHGQNRLEADVIVIGAGVRPRSQLAEKAGLKLGVKNAISVDRRQRTSIKHIWSAGDCADVYHRILQKNVYIPLALTANRAGKTAGSNIVGLETEFPGILGTAVCKVFDLTVARTGLGLAEAIDAGFDATKVHVVSRSRAEYYPGSSPVHMVLIVENGTKRLLGAQMTGLDGVAQRINTFVAALSLNMTLRQIHELDLAYAPPFSPVWDPVLIACEVAMKTVK